MKIKTYWASILQTKIRGIIVAKINKFIHLGQIYMTEGRQVEASEHIQNCITWGKSCMQIAHYKVHYKHKIHT
jgi:hypothetical protein